MNLSAAELRPGCRALLLAALLAVLPLAGPAAQPAEPGATAQDGQGGTDAKTAELEALLETLESPEEREAFVAKLRSLVEASRETAPRETPRPAPESLGARVLDTLSGRLDAIGRQVAQSLDHLLALPRVAAELWEEAQSGAARQRWLEIVGKLVLVLGIGFVAERLLIRLLARPRRSVEDRAGDSLVSRMLLLVARTLLDILPILGFALAAYVVLPLTQPREATRLVVLALVNANVIARAVGAAARLLLTPRAARLRLMPLGDETANYAYIWIRRLTAVTVYGYYFAEAVLLLGLARDVYLFLLKAVGLLVAGMIVVLILQNRTVVAGGLRGRGNETGRGLRARLAELWHVLAILYVFGLYGVWALEIHGGFVFLLRATVLTLLIASVARLATAGARRLVERGFRLGDEVKERFPGLEARANRYLPVLHRVLRIAIYVLAVLGILQVWGLGGLGWLTSETGREVGGRILTILVVVGAALLLWELVSAVIENYLRRREMSADPATGGRLLTLLPLLRNVTRVVLGVVVVMIVLSELGVDIAPLLAGAGVVGLAIGFGAQTLVKDVITGVFILLEGSVRVGDVVDLGGHAGIVESLTIRTVVLRDLQGTVHVVPFSSVTTVRNMTMDYAYAFMDVGIAYREDVDQVIEVLKEIGADLQADETFGPEILEPLEVLGLDSFGDSAVNIRIRLKTRPIKQWMIKREFNRRMKRVFDERGIEIPFPHRTLYFGVDKEGRAPPAYIRSERHETRDSAEPPQISGPDESAAQTRPAGSGTPDPT